MKLKHLPYSIALAGAVFASQQALAEGPLFWQDNSLSYLYGESFNEGQFDEEQKTQTTFTFEHASGWVWGDMFGFVDYVRADNTQSRGSTFANLEQERKNSFYYMELSPRVSLSWLTGQDLSVGPLKDVYAAFTYEKGNGGPGTENYLYGIGTAWNAPGFAYLNANLYAVKVNNHIFFDHDFKASDKGNGHTYQLTVSGAYPFAIGEQDFVIDGYIDWRAPSKDAGTQTSLGSSIQIKWDAGKALFGEGRKLYVGTEVNMWNNKYGVRPIDGSKDFDQTAVQALVKYHF
ncbi:outer membrane protein OmpK [Pseudomonas xionganensis]|uniref:Nucleoside-binding outer membrane n=1 Tax=Pseudomonas xionganensis TaxID=2654845 RepID=A0A6I4KSP8_9PSED|nr:outer membrane protein OmpK [Pseudomonas xionganensis]MVW75590.1 nucleoside-binding outer membrane [Pseudomonas xionganensis]